jgi:hypothetical protein
VQTYKIISYPDVNEKDEPINGKTWYRRGLEVTARAVDTALWRGSIVAVVTHPQGDDAWPEIDAKIEELGL